MSVVGTINAYVGTMVISKLFVFGLPKQFWIIVNGINVLPLSFVLECGWPWPTIQICIFIFYFILFIYSL